MVPRMISYWIMRFIVSILGILYARCSSRPESNISVCECTQCSERTCTIPIIPRNHTLGNVAKKYKK